MSHKRTQIRQAIASALAGLVTCGARVYPSRLRPLTAAEVPAMLVSTGSEELDTETLFLNQAQRRLLTVRVDIVVKASDGYEDTADTALQELEGRLFDSTAHNALGGIALSTTLASIGDPEMDDSTDKPVVRLPVYLRVAYF